MRTLAELDAAAKANRYHRASIERLVIAKYNESTGKCSYVSSKTLRTITRATAEKLVADFFGD